MEKRFYADHTTKPYPIFRTEFILMLHYNYDVIHLLNY